MEPTTTATDKTEKKTEHKAKAVKIKLMRDAIIPGKDIQKAGSQHEVDEATAAELCDRTFDGYHPVYGTLPEIGPLMADIPELQGKNPMDRHKITRAVRIP